MMKRATTGGHFHRYDLDCFVLCHGCLVHMLAIVLGPMKFTFRFSQRPAVRAFDQFEGAAICGCCVECNPTGAQVRGCKPGEKRAVLMMREGAGTGRFPQDVVDHDAHARPIHQCANKFTECIVQNDTGDAPICFPTIADLSCQTWIACTVLPVDFIRLHTRLKTTMKKIIKRVMEFRNTVYIQ